MKEIALIRARLLILAVATVVALLLAECVTRALDLSKTWTSYGAEHALNLGDLVTQEPVGFTRRPGTTWKMPRGFTFAANEEGFRDRPFSIAKPRGVVRVAFLGDSVTEGYGVEEAARFSNLAVVQLNARGGRVYESQNFGVVGQSTADEYMVLVQHALKFRPDIVVLQIGWNDFAPNLRKLPVVENRVAAATTRAFLPPPRAAGFRFKSFFQEHSALYLAVAERMSVWRVKRGGSSAILESIQATRPEEWDATRRILVKFVAACRAAGARPMLSYFPMDVEVLASDESRAQNASQLVRQMAIAAGADAVDILGALRARPGAELYLDDVHLTPAGHRIAAGALVAAIAEPR